MNKQSALVLAPDIAGVIHSIRDQRVILDNDLAAIYGVTTKRLNEQFRRNLDRFPHDFAFQLTRDEWAAVLKSQRPECEVVPNLKSQFATSSFLYGGRRKLPIAFTEHGALMAANILNSRRAVAMSVYVIRAFVKMRADLAANAAILKRLAEIDKTLLIHDVALREIWEKLRPLLAPPPPPPPPPSRPEIGFHVKEDSVPYRIGKRQRRKGKTNIMRILPFAMVLLLGIGPWFQARAERLTVSLDGQWQIADSVVAETPPLEFTHKVPVPGLANLARPSFEKVDAFFSREHLANRIRAKLAPEEWLTNYWKGKVDQDRNYFWYQKTFRAPAQHAVALLKINKAQFGTAVWLNGHKLGEYAGCFSASYWHLEETTKWNTENTLLVRIGAHPAVLPDTYPTGSDFEKIKWTPGIYDSVSLIFCENPLIESIQVAPRIASSEIVVQTKLKNCGSSPLSTSLSHLVKTWKHGQAVTTSPKEVLALRPGEERTITQSIHIPEAHFWSPEDPFLYQLESNTGGDTVKTRFGMREFQFDGPTRRAYLNGKVYYLRGSNITLHRFFEDPLCKDLPWNEAWVRQLLGDIPKRMNWNYFRFCIGPVPDRWFEICDEVGLLIQNEFFVWTGGPGWYKGYSRTYDSDEMIRQYKDWMRDTWNHPSVAVFDANNETKDDSFENKIIPAVRPLDLSNRPWENSYNPPAGPNDPVEDHPYLMFSGGFGKLTFKMSELETMDGKPRGSLPSSTNAPLINEYGWLWLNRDGTPTRLTENLYPQLMGTTNVTSRQRLDLYAYLLAGKTEFWRAHRQYAGIIHFVYLTCSYPGVYTADHFADVTHLKLDPAFADYMGEAFKPLGVYINFFHPTLAASSQRSFTVMLVNDYERPVEGKLLLALESDGGKILARAEKPFALKALGDASLDVPLEIPGCSGKCMLKATALPDKQSKVGPTLSRRWVTINGQ